MSWQCSNGHICLASHIHKASDPRDMFFLGIPLFHDGVGFFSVTRRSRSDVRQSVSQSVSEGTDRDFTDVTLVSDDTY